MNFVGEIVENSGDPDTKSPSFEHAEVKRQKADERSIRRKTQHTKPVTTFVWSSVVSCDSIVMFTI